MLLMGIHFPWPITDPVNLSDTAVGGLCLSAEHQNNSLLQFPT